MSDIDRLRDAMAEPPPPFSPVDIERVMTLGSRRRARRRLLTGAAVLSAFLVVAGTVVGVQIFRGTQVPASISVAAPPRATLEVRPFGTIVDTGVVDNQGHAVLYFARAAGTTRYQLVLAHKAADGTITPVSAEDADFTAGGFQGVATGHPVSFLPLYGYFTGSVRQFKATYQGDELAVFDRAVPELNVTLFWAAPKSSAEDISMSSVVQLAAFDAAGNLLANGSGPGR
ncbi:hypothetical protein [Kutzneria chonburiensis]|uniref:Uncharacterized protein n=1 Tax=Kutzneria chonburiensis TaxID=1483604 RepID=A0ABV6N615_9PSEU|nr:hypothetical protein [Kutzneria chonburiensis]